MLPPSPLLISHVFRVTSLISQFSLLISVLIAKRKLIHFFVQMNRADKQFDGKNINRLIININ